MRDRSFNLESPAFPRGVFCWLRSTIAGGTLTLSGVLALSGALFVSFGLSQPATGEVFVTAEQLAARLAAEAQRTDLANGPTSQGETSKASDGGWHDAVRPLVVVHVGHGRKGYDRGHIAGAIYVEGRDTYASREGVDTVLPTPEDFAAWLGALGIGPGVDLLLYGDAAGVFPARVYAGLTLLGLDDHARLLDGHLREWVAQGRPVSTQPPPPRDPVVIPTDLSDRVSALEARAVLDARAAKAFAGQTRVPATDQRGHLPRSVNLPWRTLVPNIQRPVIAPDAQARVFDAVMRGLPGDTARPDVFGFPLRVVDDRGNGAAVLTAILKHFGYDARFDDRGIPGYTLDNGTLVKPTPTPSTDATP
ncbi:MAG: hypothetical protein AAF328_05740 [Planctomycetota bacterium]